MTDQPDIQPADCQCIPASPTVDAADCDDCLRAASRRVLTETEHSAAWHAIEGAAGEEGADPGTVLNAVLRALNIDPPAAQPAP